jgi:hypothetical protein
MTPDLTIPQIRKLADELDKLAIQHCPRGSKSDLILANAIDHLYAVAAAREAKQRRDPAFHPEGIESQ